MLALAISGCSSAQLCTFDGTTGAALVVAADGESRAEGEQVAALVARLGFAEKDVCLLQGSRATLENLRGALDALGALDRSVPRFVYLAGRGGDVADANADEPDERDETLVLDDADGKGAGEMLDDELSSRLSALAQASASSLVVINAGHRPGDRYFEAARERKVEASAGEPDAARLLVGKAPAAGHLVVARGSVGSPDVFVQAIVAELERAATEGATLSTLARRIALRARLFGLDPEIAGGGPQPFVGAAARSTHDPGASEVSLSLRLRDATEPGGIDAPRRDAISARLGTAMEAVNVVTAAGEFELSRASDGSLVLRGPDNRVRNRVPDVAALADALAGHVVQRRLTMLRGNAAPALRDHDSIRVSLREAATQPPCANGTWDQAQAGEVQSIPLCHRWHIRVDLSPETPPLHLAALVLSSDGMTYLLPADDAPVSGAHEFVGDGRIFTAGPPIDVFDQVLVIGSTEPVDRDALLEGVVRAGDAARYTVAAISFKVIANDAFLRADVPTAREYTIKNFDVRPYLPDDDATALARFLRAADRLAKASVEDGYGYKQHPWDKPTDAENLAVGIDCSRSIWYAFTRSGQKYNRRDRFLTTAEMVTAGSWMADQFDRCPTDGGYEIGDLLVYRSDTRGDGHVVAVIDAEKRIAWGSHGWDGNPGQGLALEPDTGVEYQKIKMKPDWKKWDRADMQLKACWRYRAFARERAGGLRAAGSALLAERCSC